MVQKIPAGHFVERNENGEVNLWVGDWGTYSHPDFEPLFFHTAEYASLATLTGGMKPNPKMDDVRALQLILLEMVTRRPIEEIMVMGKKAGTVKQIDLNYYKYERKISYLAAIPPRLRRYINADLLSLIEGSFSDVVALDQAGRNILERLE